MLFFVDVCLSLFVVGVCIVCCLLLMLVAVFGRCCCLSWLLEFVVVGGCVLK